MPRLPRGLSLRVPLRIPLRLRLVFRGAFVLLVAATLGLALSVLQDEKERGLRLYAESLRKTEAQIAARLRHPAGQLALLNPSVTDRPAQPVHPLVLPFAALDFDDWNKSRQAVEMAGCGLQYPDGATFCAAVGANPYAGGFVYLVASLAAAELTAHESGDLELAGVHRVLVDVDYRGTRSRWIAPYERSRDGRGRLTGYAGDAPLAKGVRPLRDFRGWLWQEGRCIDASQEAPGCLRRSFVSIRLPLTVFQDQIGAARDAGAGGGAARPPWPPADLDRMAVRLRLLAPDRAGPVFDSDTPGATMPFSLAELRALLRPGEQLQVRRAAPGAAAASAMQAALFTLTGPEPGEERGAAWVDRLVRRLPAAGAKGPLVERSRIDTSLGRFELELSGDPRTVDRALSAVATRVAWTVGAMLLAIGGVWIALEWLVIRRVALLTSRTAAGLSELNLSGLGGRDELGVLAQGLKDLLQRVREDVERDRIRAAQEKDMWHAVGHEIMAPLQSLMALHAEPGDPSARYIARMQQAVRVLYGQASPSEAFEATRLALRPVDLDAFLSHVAANAKYVGIDGVEYRPHGAPVLVHADEHGLEDVVSHLLRNAARHRRAATPIRLRLDPGEGAGPGAGEARVTVHNDGDPVPAELLARIFEYGVSGAPADEDDGPAQRGQGLFVARTYMAKMGGTISVRNVEGGVEFTLALRRLGSHGQAKGDR